MVPETKYLPRVACLKIHRERLVLILDTAYFHLNLLFHGPEFKEMTTILSVILNGDREPIEGYRIAFLAMYEVYLRS